MAQDQVTDGRTVLEDPGKMLIFLSIYFLCFSGVWYWYNVTHWFKFNTVYYAEQFSCHRTEWSWVKLQLLCSQLKLLYQLFFFYCRHGSPNREPRRQHDGEKFVRTTWQGPPPGHRNPPQSDTLQSGPPTNPPAGPRPTGRTSAQPPHRSFNNSRAPTAPHRTEGRGYPKPSLDGPPPRGFRPQPAEVERGPRLKGRGSYSGRADRSPALLVEDIHSEEEEGEIPLATTTYTAHHYKTERDRVPSPRKQDPGLVAEGNRAAGHMRESSPPQERTVEKKSYSLVRRATRTRPSDLGKQASLDDSSTTVQQPGTAAKGESWQEQTEAGTQGGLTGLDQDLARLSLAGQNWAQSPPSYLQAEMRGNSFTTCFYLTFQSGKLYCRLYGGRFCISSRFVCCRYS